MKSFAYKYTYIHTHTYIHTYIHTYTHTCTLTHTLTHIHTYTHTGRQGNPNILHRLTKLVTDSGRTYITVLLSEITPQKLALFEDVDAWIQVRIRMHVMCYVAIHCACVC